MSNPVLHDPFCVRMTSGGESRGTLQRGETLLIAASGGIASTALVTLCAALRESWRLTIHLGHVVIRPEAHGVVEKLGRTLSLPVHEIREQKPPPLGTDQFSRLLLNLRANIGATRIALGDTEDHLLEMFFSRVISGAEPDTLAGVPREETFVRPLAATQREDCRAFLERQHIPYERDVGRLELRDGPSRTRLLLLPFLHHHVAPDLATAITRLRSRLAEDASFLTELSYLARADVHWTAREGEVSLDVRRAHALPPPLRRRLLQDAFRVAAPDINLADAEISRLLTALGKLDDGVLPNSPTPLSIRRTGDTLLLRHV